MDPITLVIYSSVMNLTSHVIRDSYMAFREALLKKFSGKKDLVDAVNKLEEQPDSQARKDLLKEEVNKAGVNDDPEILKLAQELQALLKQLNAKEMTSKYSNDIAGDFKGIQGDISGGSIIQNM